MYTVSVSIRGVRPLMQHRMAVPGLSDIAKGSKKSTGSPDYTQEWHDYFYADKDGIYQPAEHVLGAMTKAGGAFKISGKRGKTYRDLIQSSLEVKPDRIPHHVPKPDELDEDADKPLYLDTRMVTVNRAHVPRVRPTFHAGWCLEFELVVDDDNINPQALNEILIEAGKHVGIGDHRPRFGLFMVERFEVSR